VWQYVELYLPLLPFSLSMMSMSQEPEDISPFFIHLSTQDVLCTFFRSKKSWGISRLTPKKMISPEEHTKTDMHF